MDEEHTKDTRKPRRELLAAGGLGIGALLMSACAEGDAAARSHGSTSLALGTNINVDAIEDYAALKALATPTSSDTQVYTVLGYSAAGDGGGGLFYWDSASTASDNDGTILTPNSSPSSGRWLRLYDGAYVSVRWFGAKGDNATDDTASIQQAIDSAVALGIPVVLFPAGDYRTTATLELHDDGTRNSRGVRLSGLSLGASTTDKARSSIRWQTQSTTASIIEAFSRDSGIENLDIYCGYSMYAYAAVTIDPSSISGASIMTNFHMKNVRIQSGAGVGDLNYAVVIGPGNAGNTDYNCFEHCHFYGCVDANVYIDSSSYQSKQNIFYRCAFAHSPFGILTDTGSFRTYGCGFTHCDTAIYLGAPTDSICIRDTDTESCARFLDVPKTNSAARWPIVISGGRFALNSLHADGEYIRYSFAGPLRVEGAIFEGVFAGSSDPDFRIVARNPYPAASLAVEDCVLPNAWPFSAQRSDDSSGGYYCRLRSLGNVCPSGPATTEIIPDTMTVITSTFFPVTPTLQQRDVSVGDVRLSYGSVVDAVGVSGDSTPTANLRGTATFPQGISVRSVAFGDAEADADYIVTASVLDESGSPGTGALRPRVANRSTSGFDLVLEAAPAAGASVTVGWILVG